MGANQSYEADYNDVIGTYQDGGKGSMDEGNRKKKKVKPTPPPRPIVTGVTHNTVSLSWQPPRNSFQHAIIAYTVEIRPTNPNTTINNQHTNNSSSKLWQILTKNCQGTHYDARHLNPDTEYVFRVRAENIFGTGKPSTPSDSVTTRLFESSCDDTSFGLNNQNSFNYNTTTANASFPLTNSIATDAVINTATFLSPINLTFGDTTDMNNGTSKNSNYYENEENKPRINLCSSFLSPAPTPTPLLSSGDTSSTSSTTNIFDYNNIAGENESSSDFLNNGISNFMVKSPTFPVDSSSTLLSSPTSSFETLSPSTPTSPHYNTSNNTHHHRTYHHNHHSYHQLNPNQQPSASMTYGNVKRRHSFNIHLDGNVSSILNHSGRFNSTTSLTPSNSNSLIGGNLNNSSSNTNRRFRSSSMRTNIEKTNESTTPMSSRPNCRLSTGSTSSILLRNDANRCSLQLQPTHRKASIPIILPGTGSSSIDKLRESRAASSRSHSFLLSPSRSSEFSGDSTFPRHEESSQRNRNRGSDEARNSTHNGDNNQSCVTNQHIRNNMHNSRRDIQKQHRRSEEFRYSVGSTASDATNTTSSTHSASSKDESSSGCYSNNSNRLSTQSALSDLTLSTYSQSSEDNAVSFSSSSRPVSCHSGGFSDLDNGDGSSIIGYNNTVNSFGKSDNVNANVTVNGIEFMNGDNLSGSKKCNDDNNDNDDDNDGDFKTPTLLRKENGMVDNGKGSQNIYLCKSEIDGDFVSNSSENVKYGNESMSIHDIIANQDLKSLKIVESDDMISEKLNTNNHGNVNDKSDFVNNKQTFPNNRNQINGQNKLNEKDCYYQTLENPWQLDTDSVNGVSENVMAAPFTDDVKIAFHAERNKKLFSNNNTNNAQSDDVMGNYEYPSRHSPNQTCGNNQSINSEFVMENGGDFRTLLSVLQSNQVLVRQSRSMPEVVGVVLSEGGEPRRALTRGTLTTIEDNEEEEEAVRVTTL